MPNCSQCDAILDLAWLFCPHCGQASARPIEGKHGFLDGYVVVAKMAEMAEAGFLTEELLQKGQIPARLELEEHYNPIDASWGHRVKVLVPEKMEERAKQHLARLVADFDKQKPMQADTQFDTESEFSEKHGTNEAPEANPLSPLSLFFQVVIIVSIAAIVAVLVSSR